MYLYDADEVLEQKYRDEGVEKWRYDAKCKDGKVYELFHPPRDKDLYMPTANKAKDICFGRDNGIECPVRIACLLYAESQGDTHGIWGGLSHRERNALRRKAERNLFTLEEWVKYEGTEADRLAQGVLRRQQKQDASSGISGEVLPS